MTEHLWILKKRIFVLRYQERSCEYILAICTHVLENLAKMESANFDLLN